MELLTPGIGLIFWQAVVFLTLFFVLLKFAWKPILKGLHDREEFISKSLSEAQALRKQMDDLKVEQRALIEKANRERDTILKKAHTVAQEIEKKAREETQKIADHMLAEAKLTIRQEEKEAMKKLKELVATLAIGVSEKVLRDKLASDATTRALVQKYLEELSLSN